MTAISPEAAKAITQINGNLLLDQQVIEKVMGWKCVPDGMMHERKQLVFEEPNGDTHSIACGCDEDFNPSVDIADAMQVVEKMREQGRTINMINLDKDSGEPYRSGDRWRVNIWPSSQASQGNTASAPTLPRAICLAALSVVSV